MYSVSKCVSRVVAIAALAMLPVAMMAQDAAKPAAKAPAGDSPSRWDIFAGYSYLAPKGDVAALQPGNTTVTSSFDAVNVGGLFSGAYFFNKFVGAQVEVGEHEWGTQNSSVWTDKGSHGNNDGFLTGSLGLIARYPTGQITPFVHALVGGVRMDGPAHQFPTWGPVLTAGGGLDYSTPLFNHHLGIRLFQADYEYMHGNYGPGIGQGRANINAARLSTGIVYHIGSIEPPPAVTLACSAAPTSVFAGEPVTITGTAANLDPKLSVVYGWTGSGVTAKGATASVDTAALAPGSYTVKGSVKEGKAGKEGLKPGQSAECAATFTVKEFEPPTISCSASPSSIKTGETANIAATAVSPQNRPLTYSYSATAGSVSGTGNSAVYNSTGAPVGVNSVTCSVADDKGHTATASTTVEVVKPYVPPVPRTQALCTIGFSKDKKRPTRVDNEAKACLDDVALSLQKQADAKAVVVGEKDATEAAKLEKQTKLAAKNKHLKVVDPAAERAVNAKEYLVTEKGIDATRVSVATGATAGQTVEDYLVPAGANFATDVNGTTPVNETAVKAQPRKPLAAKKHAAKKK